MTRFTSRKLILTLLTNLVAVFMAFGGNITAEQAVAVIALVNSLYLVVNLAEHRVSGTPLEKDAASEVDVVDGEA